MTAKFRLIQFITRMSVISVLRATFTSGKRQDEYPKPFVCTFPRKKQHEPTVQVPSCSYEDLPVIASGHFHVESCSGRDVGDFCLMECEDNYYPTTDIETSCELYGSAKAAWSFPEDGFHCTAITCPYTELPEVSNGFFGARYCNGDGVGDFCILMCYHDNYYPSASNKTVCKADGRKGKWATNGDLLCTAVTCSYDDLPDVVNGSFNKASCDGNNVGDKCRVKCAENHLPSPSTETVCENVAALNGSWTNKQGFVCTPIACKYDDLPLFPNGIFNTSSCDGNFVGDGCNLTCADTHFPSTLKRTVCQNRGFVSGTWSHENEFSCTAITCSYQELPEVSKGFFDRNSCSGNLVGDACNVTCYEDFYPISSFQTVCESQGEATGKWFNSGDLVCTAITCPYDELPFVRNSVLWSCYGNRVGEECSFTCLADYYPTSSVTTTCLKTFGGVNGRWSNETVFACEAITCSYNELPTVTKGNFSEANCSGNSVGDICTLTCLNDHYPVNQAQTTCKNVGEPNGTWIQRNDFVCEAITCPYNELPNVRNSAQWSCFGSTVGKECHFTCMSDYYPTSSVITTCLKTSGSINGRWSNDTEFACEAITCSYDELPNVTKGNFSEANCSGNLVGDTCTLTCLDDHYPIDQTQTTCKNVGEPNGTWVHKEDFVCEAVLCSFHNLPVHPGIYFDKESCSGNQVGSECHVNCHIGYYNTSEEPSVVCKNSGGLIGTWSEVNAYICEAILCSFDTLPSVINGSFNASNCSGNHVGDTCNITCIDGTYLTNATESTCQIAGPTNGSWSNNNDTICSVVRCSLEDIPYISNAVAECTGDLVGDVCNVTCIDGFDPRPTFQTTCTYVGTGKGQWSNRSDILCPAFWSTPIKACTTNENIYPSGTTVSSLQKCKDMCRQETSTVCLSIDYLNNACFLGYANQHNIADPSHFTAPCYFPGYVYLERLDVGSWTGETNLCVAEEEGLWYGDMVDLASCKLVCSQTKGCCSVVFQNGRCYMDSFERISNQDLDQSYSYSCDWIYTERTDVFCPPP